ncbi:hypothetical protein GCM10010415_40910 [Streptomyces atrovirens]
MTARTGIPRGGRPRWTGSRRTTTPCTRCWPPAGGDTGPWNPRTGREETPEPWAWLGARAEVARVWEVQGTGRWVAVAVADRDPDDAVQLLAVVTETPPR